MKRALLFCSALLLSGCVLVVGRQHVGQAELVDYKIADDCTCLNSDEGSCAPIAADVRQETAASKRPCLASMGPKQVNRRPISEDIESDPFSP